jgi:hypothetical protein
MEGFPSGVCGVFFGDIPMRTDLLCVFKGRSSYEYY